MRSFVLTLPFAAACGGGDAAPPAPPPPAVRQELPTDSLALAAPGGVTVWFTGGRQARDASGSECLERALEIRSPAGSRGIPLLYTLEAPVVLDDTSISARVYTGCQPGDRYRVSLRTGRPTPMPRP